MKGEHDVVSGYLDVKISSRSRRGFTPWKAWKKQWCEIKRLDSIENGVELKFKSSVDGTVLNNILLPRSSTLCRTESRTKQYAFGVFTLGRTQKPLLFLSGNCESDSQMWMSSIRKTLCIASYLPVGEFNFHVSIVDNAHSRKAGLLGLHGVLGTTSQEIVVSDSCTGHPKISWKWYQFHQFHLQAPSHKLDDKMICVIHTSAEFVSGPGQLYLYCKESPKLLNSLLNRGKNPKVSNGLLSNRRLSRSEGDLCCSNSKDTNVNDGPEYFSSNNGSEDSGVRTSLSDDCTFSKNKACSSLTNLGLAVLTKTPGGSETNDESIQDLSAINDQASLPRRESGISISSGIYEEIPEDVDTLPSKKLVLAEFINHVYENPVDVLSRLTHNGKCIPPPLPPRQFEQVKTDREVSGRKTTNPLRSVLPYKQRCNTLPAKDLSRISQIFTSESEYTVMTLPKPNNRTNEVFDCQYVPMSPITNLKVKLENYYMVMSGTKKH